MPVQTEVTSNTLSMNHLLTALGLSVTIMLSLVGIIYNLIRKELNEHREALNDGADMFTANAVVLAGLKAEMQSVREWMIAAERIIKELEIKQLQDHDKLIEIKQDHKNNHP